MDTKAARDPDTLPPGQRRCLDAFVAMRAEDGVPPTIKGLAARLGITGPGVYNTILVLNRKGFIVCHRHPGSGRARRYDLPHADGDPRVAPEVPEEALGPLTERQRAVWRAIWDSWHRDRLVPTHQELMDRFGWRSKQAAEGYFLALERKGFLARNGSRRSLRPVLPTTTEPVN